MPHPTPVQIAYGSATVISATLLLLVLAPTGSTLAVSLVAVVALMLGVVVALACQSRRDAGRPAATVHEPATDTAQATHSPHPATDDADRSAAPEAAREPGHQHRRQHGARSGHDHRVPARSAARAGSARDFALRGR